jgi:hypothetical protein
MKELAGFLVDAKVATYASVGEKEERILDDGGKELSFFEETFRYRDRYYGFNPFSGEEVVWQKGKIIWSMNYYGKIEPSELSDKEVYAFLQDALRRVESERPFRGPERFESGDLIYVNDVIGDVSEFVGTERILFKGEEIYRLRYHGGIIASRV